LKKEKIRSELDKKAQDAESGVGYGPSMGVEQVDDSEIGMPVETEQGKSTALSTSRKRGKKTRSPRVPELCQDCNTMTTTHKSMRSSKCKNHWMYLQQKGTFCMCLYVMNHPIHFFYLAHTHLCIFSSSTVKCHFCLP